MTSSSSSNDASKVLLDKLKKIKARFHSDHPASMWPPTKCDHVSAHLAGAWLVEHLDELIHILEAK